MRYFETIRCKDGIAYNLDYHNRRVFNTINKTFDFDAIIKPPTKELYRCKVIYDKNSIISIEYFLYNKKEIKTIRFVKSNDIEYNFKYLNRDSISKLLDDNYSDILIVKNDLVTDTSIANIAIFYNNRWLTPMKPLLYGTTRQRYIDNGFLKEVNITTSMVKDSTKIAFLNAMIDFDIYCIDDIRFD